MDEARYNSLVAALFKKILAVVDQADPDVLEADSTGDMLTLTSAKGEKCIVNTQRAVRQIWVAGKGEGLHFSHQETSGLWMDDKGKGIELLAFVGEAVLQMSGLKLSFR